MKTVFFVAAAVSLIAAAACAAEPAAKEATDDAGHKAATAPLFTPESVASEGSVTVEGTRIEYRAVAGTLIVHPKEWDDAAHPDRDAGDRKGEPGPEAGGGPEAS